MNCSQYKRLGDYFNIMMPTKREEIDKVSEGYTRGGKDDKEFSNKFFQDEYKQNYEYGVKEEKKPEEASKK